MLGSLKEEPMLVALVPTLGFIPRIVDKIEHSVSLSFVVNSHY